MKEAITIFFIRFAHELIATIVKSKSKKIFFNISKDNSKVIIKLLQPLTLENGSEFDLLLQEIHNIESNEVIIDFSQILKFDTYALLFFNELQQISSKKKIINIGITRTLDDFLNKFQRFPKRITQEIIHNPFIEYFSNIGEKTKFILKDFYGFIEFFGEVLVKSSAIFYKPLLLQWENFQFLLIQSGVNAVPIVSLILLLIGIISGYQGAIQLKQFGADIYIADLIGVSITRELGPLMTAILVAGRSGSAFTAELGTMKVSEEIDVLRSMGFDPIRFLVIPRIFSVTITIPFLLMIGNLAGILGGLISALAILDITSVGYFTELRVGVNLGDIFSGLIKTTLFGFIIGTIGCYRGMQVRGGAESVGNYTTISVVSSIFTIIVTDAFFTFIFDAIGL